MLRQAGANELKHTLIKAEPGSPGLNGYALVKQEKNNAAD